VPALVTPREDLVFRPSKAWLASQELHARNTSCEHESHLHKDCYNTFMADSGGQRSAGEFRQIL